MGQESQSSQLQTYDTTTLIIGSLQDSSVIFKAIESYFCKEDSVNDLVNQRNEFNLRTEKSRSRIGLAVKRAFLQFQSEDHEDFFRQLFQSDIPQNDKELFLIWQFALNNRLFREISARVFAKVYYSGRARISKDDVIGYLKEFIGEKIALNIKWTETTISTLSTKYLNLLTKLNFLSAGRTKSFRHVRPSAEAQVIFLYFAKLVDPQSCNILVNELLPLLFVPSEDINDRLKKLSLKGFFNMNFNGVALNIELIHSYKGICDVLYNRS